MPKAIHSREHRIFTRVMREIRDKAGLRQQDLAERLGRPQSYVSKYESGERRLDILELREICGILGLDLIAFAKRLERELGTRT